MTHDIFFELLIHFEFTSNLLYSSRMHSQFTIFFANKRWISSLIREFTINSLSFSQIHCEFTMFFANSLWIHYLFHFESSIFKSNSSIRIYYRFTIYVANSLWIHYLFREFTINLLCFKQHYLTLSCYVRPNFNLWWLFMTWFDQKLFLISILDF